MKTTCLQSNFHQKNAKIHFLQFYLIFNQGVQLYTTKVNKQSKLTIFGQCCYQKALPPAFCLINNTFCAENRLDLKKMLQHYAETFKSHTIPYLGIKKGSNLLKSHPKALKLIICNKTYPQQVFWAKKINVRSVLKCVFWCCTGHRPLFNLRPKSFIVSTKITKNQSLFLNSFIIFPKKHFYTASTNTSPFFSCKENTTLNISRSSEG